MPFKTPLAITTVLGLIVMAAAWPIARAEAQESVIQEKEYRFEYRADETKQTIAFSGGISFSNSREIVELFRSKLVLNKDIVLNLSGNEGGVVGAYQDIHRIAKANCSGARTGEKTCSITTLVDRQYACASSCLILFMAGDSRLLAPGAAIGFHAPRWLWLRGNADDWKRYIEPVGVNPEWIDAFQHVFASVNLVMLEYKELHGSNIATGLLERGGHH